MGSLGIWWWFAPTAWYTVCVGGSCSPPEKITDQEATTWYLDAQEDHWASGKLVVLWKWVGTYWNRVH